MPSDARERILDAACDLIAAEGIDEVRIARVAMKAGASTALVHHYFATRQELLEQALVHSFESVGDERFADEPEGGESATARLARAIGSCLPTPGRGERDWVLWVELWLRAARDPALRPIAANLYGRYRRWLTEAIAAGIATGEFDASADARDLADEAIALLDGYGVRALLGDPEMEVGRARERVARVLARELGLAPEALI